MQRRVSVLIGLATPLAALGGPYSSGLNNTTSGAPDAGVAGFVGSAGAGRTATPNAVNPAFVGWASSVTSYLPAGTVDSAFSDPSAALGPVTGDNFDVVSLGEGSGDAGQITLKFNGGIRNGSGGDFAVFENSFGSSASVFADLARVQVSSDGVHFAEFASISLTPSTVGAYGSIDPTNVHNLAGKHVNAYGNSWGTPFDLSELSGDPLVTGKQVNLNGIAYVRLIDVVGDGNTADSAGHPIYDAFPTYGSGGFDLEAIGALNAWRIGDCNLDGKVDITDLGILATHWQAKTTAGFAAGDFNGDGIVDISDLSALAQHWQDGVSLTAALQQVALPEPGLLSLVALLGLASLRKRIESRRRKCV